MPSVCSSTNYNAQSLFSFWSIFLTLLAIAFWYYCNRLMAVVQDNNATGRTRNAAMIRAVKRVRRN